MNQDFVSEVAAKTTDSAGAGAGRDAANVSQAVVAGLDSASSLEDLQVRASTLTPSLEEFRHFRTFSRWGLDG